MNTGGKYDSKAFKKSVGLNGVGTKAVNALSSFFRVESSRDGKSASAEFSQGNLENQDFLEESSRRKGTKVSVFFLISSTWTKKLSQVTGKKGKELYMPLRLCLTGQNKGPEMADLILMMGRDKVIKRLSNQV